MGSEFSLRDGEVTLDVRHTLDREQRDALDLSLLRSNVYTEREIAEQRRDAGIPTEPEDSRWAFTRVRFRHEPERQEDALRGQLDHFIAACGGDR